MRTVTLAATQMACSWDHAANIAQADALVRQAAAQGAQIILLPELFETPYFCQDRLSRFLDLARPVADSPGYSEKFYFSPGDTGFRVWRTAHAVIGVGICWDQWFPETHRAMALMGAEVLLFPTAIGTEPSLPELDCSGHWQRTMQGQAGANVMPLVASNRIGTEAGQEGSEMTFFGRSFIADQTGDKLCDAGHDAPGVLTATFDLDAIAQHRAFWGTFRDRRPELYGPLLTLDGVHRHVAGA